MLEFLEAVISMLVEKFKFSPSPDKEVFWQMTGIASPLVINGDNHPQMPLVVELAK
jgi:hypothetical protein